MRLSPHFRLEHLTYSETAERCGIDNTPPAVVLENLRLLAEGLEQVQAVLGHPLEISSAYRCPELNQAVGGAPASQHLEGRAVDFCCPGFGTPAEVARAVTDSGVAFDSLILEFGRWVHLSFAITPRRRVLSINDDARGYREGLWDEAGNRLA
jgi:zinc D-Ala-D-Ala carboxypeptidase